MCLVPERMRRRIDEWVQSWWVAAGPTDEVPDIGPNDDAASHGFYPAMRELLVKLRTSVRRRYGL